MAVKVGDIIAIVISFIMIATLVPIGLDQLMSATLPTSTPTAVVTIIQTVIPIMAMVGILLGYVSSVKQQSE